MFFLLREGPVLAYVAAIVAAWLAMRRSRRGRTWWAGCVATLLLLAIEQQIGLFGRLTDGLRGIAVAQHWYADRAPLQREAVLGLGLAGLLAAALLLIGLRRESRSLRVAIVVTIGLLALALIKAISLHRLDRLFTRFLPGMPLAIGASLELAGIALVVVASLAAALSRRGRRARA